MGGGLDEEARFWTGSMRWCEAMVKDYFKWIDGGV